MIKINSAEFLKNIKGDNAVQNEGGDIPTVGMAISNILLSAKEGGKMKMFTLAQKFAMDKSVEIDQADFALIKKAVENSEDYNNLVIGQILVMFETLKDNKD